jgi:hypothetical protein
MNTTVETVASADGTPIAFERMGQGAPVILIGGRVQRPVHGRRAGGRAGPSRHDGHL